MLPSGYLIRPCEGGGSIIHIVDHMDLEVGELLHFVLDRYFSLKMNYFLVAITCVYIAVECP